jgi:hypothetical protein
MHATHTAPMSSPNRCACDFSAGWHALPHWVQMQYRLSCGVSSSSEAHVLQRYIVSSYHSTDRTASQRSHIQLSRCSYPECIAAIDDSRSCCWRSSRIRVLVLIYWRHAWQSLVQKLCVSNSGQCFLSSPKNILHLCGYHLIIHYLPTMGVPGNLDSTVSTHLAEGRAPTEEAIRLTLCMICAPIYSIPGAIFDHSSFKARYHEASS